MSRDAPRALVGVPDGRPSRRDGVVLGVVVAAFAIAAGQLAATLVAADSSPLLAVGQAAIDRTPEWLKSFAIREFGTNDKLALLAGMLVVLVVLAAVAGIAGHVHRSP